MEQLENSLLIADLIKRKVLSEKPLSPGEETFLEEWLNQSEEHRLFYGKLQQKAFLQEYRKVIHLSPEEEQWQKLSGHLPSGSSQNKRNRIYYTAISAAVVVLLLSGLFRLTDYKASKELPFLSGPEKNLPGQAMLLRGDGQQWLLNHRDTLIATEDAVIRIANGEMTYAHKEDSLPEVSSYNTLIVPREGIFALTLSDGSKVFLNSESELRFPENFSAGKREVFLKGEAIFDVKPAPERPFWVHTGKMHVKVLGTYFSVTAYEDEPFLRTTLLSGKVEVSIDDIRESKTLTPGMQAFWEEESPQVKLRPVDPEALLSWKDGIMVFQEERLDVIMRMLARWYDIEVIYLDDSVKKQYFTNRINRNRSLEEVLKTLTLLGGPMFEVKEKTVYVY